MDITLEDAKRFCRHFKYCNVCPASNYGEWQCCGLGGQFCHFPSNWRIKEFEAIYAEWKDKLEET